MIISEIKNTPDELTAINIMEESANKLEDINGNYSK